MHKQETARTTNNTNPKRTILLLLSFTKYNTNNRTAQNSFQHILYIQRMHYNCQRLYSQFSTSLYTNHGLYFNIYLFIPTRNWVDAVFIQSLSPINSLWRLASRNADGGDIKTTKKPHSSTEDDFN